MKGPRKYLISLLLLTTPMTILVLVNNNNYNKTNVKLNSSVKAIYCATTFFGSSLSQVANKAFDKCDSMNVCYATDDVNFHTHFGDYDAVLFHLDDIQLYRAFKLFRTMHYLNKNRSQRQRFVALELESPEMSHFKIYEQYSNFFNWTMTYRKSSDIYAPYGLIRSKHHRNKERPKSTRVPVKSKSVVWLVSHCNTFSKRENYVSELKKYIEVDIFGLCTNYNRVEVNVSEYNFYISFENSLCQDYVSEKFFANLKKDVIPIVMGGANYSAIAPPKSYIDVYDFPNPKHLANYLKLLENDPKEFNSYFRWKRDFEIMGGQGFCNLCDKLHSDSEEKSYAELRKWFYHDQYGGNVCRDGTEQEWDRYKESIFHNQITQFVILFITFHRPLIVIAFSCFIWPMLALNINKDKNQLHENVDVRINPEVPSKDWNQEANDQIRKRQNLQEVIQKQHGEQLEQHPRIILLNREGEIQRYPREDPPLVKFFKTVGRGAKNFFGKMWHFVKSLFSD